ncbi:dCTP deaminase [Streptomyces venezuelae]|uniref:dCTP deaminase n=1 Tax=Streptomyces venezuelae TaxID=54571 RepID=UPI00366809EB
MILTGPQIAEEVDRGRVKISPFTPAQITTNSYDLRLGRKYLTYDDEVLDPRRPPSCAEHAIPDEGIVLKGGEFILAETEERIGGDHFVPLVHGKSSTARSGLFVHVTADLIDIGSYGKSTLQLFATIPVKLYPGMLIAQVTFWVPKGDIVLYTGKYQNSDGPRPSLTYLDCRAVDA